MTVHLGKDYYREYRNKNKARIRENRDIWIARNKERFDATVTANREKKSAARHNLTQEELLKIVSYDRCTGLFTRRSTGELCDIRRSNGYMGVSIKGYVYASHRLAWMYVTKNWPDEELDHANHDRTDNRFDNLSPASRAENARNIKLRRDNSSGVTGLDELPGGSWRARITYNGVTHTIGCFSTKEEAAKARKEAQVNFKFHANHGRG